MDAESYRTLSEPSPGILYKDKNSKFFGYAFPMASEDDARAYINCIRGLHPEAGHYCYAWRLGTGDIAWRANDDGEPNNSAGMPILGQLQSFGLTNCIVVVARIFGGVKLGVGGLISAYRTAAQLTLSSASIIEKQIVVAYTLRFDYAMTSKIMKTIRENRATVIAQRSSQWCEIDIECPLKHQDKIRESFSAFGADVTIVASVLESFE